MKRMKDINNLPEHEELDDLQREFDILEVGFKCHGKVSRRGSNQFFLYT